MIEIDGSKGEAGGQIVRTVLGLSVLLGKAFRVTHIRQGRPQPGLKAQHLQCIEALKKLCVCDVQGATLGSEEITFIPGKFLPKNIEIDIGTAGSITLLLQSLLLPCLFSKKKITLKIVGGTDVAWAMPIDYFIEVVIPQLQRFCFLDVKLMKRGYYPKGGGSVEISFKPKQSLDQLQPFSLTERGELLYIKGVSHASKSLQEKQVAERQREAALMRLKHLNVPVTINMEYTDTLSLGSGITLWAIFSLKDEIDNAHPLRLGADALGEKNIPAEDVGAQAAEQLLKEISSGTPVDKHLADNLIPLLGLVGGSIRISEITPHTLTNISVVEQFLDVKFEIDEEKKIIRCEKK